MFRNVENPKDHFDRNFIFYQRANNFVLICVYYISPKIFF